MDTTYYNLNGQKLFLKTGGDKINMMVLTDKAKMDENEFTEGGYHSFDLSTLDLTTLDEMYDFSDKNGKECYYAIKGDGTPTNRQIGTEDDVSDALFDAINWQYNVHTHCKSKLIKEPSNVTNNTEPSNDKDRVGVGNKFGIILGYKRINMDAGYTGMTFNNGESPRKPNFRYKKEIRFYDSGGRIGNSIPYDDFKKTVRKIKTGK